MFFFFKNFLIPKSVVIDDKISDVAVVQERIDSELDMRAAACDTFRVSPANRTIRGIDDCLALFMMCMTSFVPDAFRR